MKLYNTMTRQADELRPLESGKVSMYTCGLTVYSQPHIGNWVAYIYWDLLVRTLRAHDHDVTRVQNITDVGHLTDDGDAGEDKMQKGALREGKTAWDVAQKYIDIADHEAYTQLGLIRPDELPRATDYIPQQIAFVEALEEKGYTYTIDDGVYFDTSKLADYGKLARLDIDGLEFGARVADTGKRNPTDFALWKFSPTGEKRDMEWDSPWGLGFPGWHLECSVMARELLGDTIDIHTGGIDHIPVHHTNEIAQTESVTGQTFANMWVHANHMKVDGTKMSKSLGNIYTLADLKERDYDLMAFKLFVYSKHYRSEGNFTFNNLTAAQNRLTHWRNVAALRHQTHDDIDESTEMDPSPAAIGAVREALGDDLNTPEALRIIDETFNYVESHSLARVNHYTLTELLTALDDMLGLQLLDSTPDISDEQKQLILGRQRARDDKDWAKSDELRDTLAGNGIAVRDTPQGPVWEYTRK